jgi:hypothetical protein
MNALQIAKQLKYLLSARAWQETGGETVFGSVHVTNGLPEDQYKYLRMPACLVGIDEDKSDDEEPNYVQQVFRITYMIQSAGDLRGEFALIGGPRPSGAASSKNRGIMEVEEEVSGVLRQVQETNGVKIIGRRRSHVGTGIIKGTGYLAARTMMVEVKCTDARYYHPPLRVAGAVAGANVTLTWSDPPTRFDGDGRTLRIRRAAGAIPPTTVTGGIQVADVARGVGTYVDAPGVGQWSYTIFAGYTDTGIASNERYSEGTATEDGISTTEVVV